MPVYELTIELKSPLVPGSGDSIPGVVDQDIAHENGLPLIPAKRLKGALRGVAKELKGWGLCTEGAVKSLFGDSGRMERSGFKMYDAVMTKLPEGLLPKCSEIEDYEKLQQAITSLQPQQVVEKFTQLYTKTAMQTDGTAKKGALRTLRAIHEGAQFTSRIELDSANNFELLQKCVKGLRHLGYGRTRGLGEVRCFIKEVAQLPTQQVKASQTYVITLQQPALLAGDEGLYYSCTDFVPGSVLLGVFASLYIKKYKLGNEAHTDDTFKRLFLDGAVSFGYAHPYVNEHHFMPMPLHIQREKNTNCAYYEGTITQSPLRKMNTLARIANHKIYTYDVPKEYRMHHSRPEDRSIGRALNDTKGTDMIKDDKGQFYYYTALQKGQQFVGELKGNSQDIALLYELAEEANHIIHIGRSRTAEYGAAKFSSHFSVAPSFPKARKGAKKVAIYVASPLTWQNSYGRNVADSTLLLNAISAKLGVTVTLEKTYSKQTVIAGYNAKWRLPKPKYQAFDAGTVFVVSTDKEVDWSLIEQQQWGQETARGCGQLYVLAYTSEEFSIEAVTSQQPSAITHPIANALTHAIELDKRLTAAKNDSALHDFVSKLKGYHNSELFAMRAHLVDEKPLTAKQQEKFRTMVKEISDTIKIIVASHELEQEHKGIIISELFYLTELEVRSNANR